MKKLLLVAFVLLAFYSVDLVEYAIQEADSTWVYSVTGCDSAIDEAACHELSYFELGLQPCYTVTAPIDTYSTPTSGYGCGTVYNCKQSTYEVETKATSIKWENPSDPLLCGTHIFTMTVEGSVKVGEIPSTVKYGRRVKTSMVEGPVCDTTSVVLERVDTFDDVVITAAICSLFVVAFILWAKETFGKPS